MALAVSRNLSAGKAATARRSVRPSRRVVAVQAASLGDVFNFVGQAFVRIFSPAQVDKSVPWETTGGNVFSARVKHDRHKRPFEDEYDSRGSASRSKAAAVSTAAVQPETQEPQPVAGEDYLGGAVQRVIGNNFKGDATDPKVGTGSAGWKGDIHHDRKEQGFHSKTY